MRRRKALKLMAMASAGTVVFSSCQITKLPVLDYLTIDKPTYRKLGKLVHKVLPIPEDLILANMSPQDFMLIMTDDCGTPEEIEGFEMGMNAFFEENPNFKSLTDEELTALLSNNAFLQTVKRYNVWYYQGLEEYLEEYTDYEFVPGRFLGCVNV